MGRSDPDPAGMADLALAQGADRAGVPGRRPAFVGASARHRAAAAAAALLDGKRSPPHRRVAPQIFKARTGAFSAPGRFSAAHEDAAALFEALGRCGNDLTAPALTLAPAIAEVLAALAAQPGCALSRMSGSGATCFGLFAEAGPAAAAAAALAVAHPRWWVQPAPMLAGAAETGPPV